MRYFRERSDHEPNKITPQALLLALSALPDRTIEVIKGNAMRLSELDPKWLEKDGRRVGIVFRCPHCAHKPLGHGSDAGCYVSCFFVPQAHISGPDGQYALIAQVIPEEFVMDVVPCKRNYAWQISPDINAATFENMSITPSLDASAARHWHGHITNGEVK